MGKNPFSEGIFLSPAILWTYARPPPASWPVDKLWINQTRRSEGQQETAGQAAAEEEDGGQNEGRQDLAYLTRNQAVSRTSLPDSGENSLTGITTLRAHAREGGDA